MLNLENVSIGLYSSIRIRCMEVKSFVLSEMIVFPKLFVFPQRLANKSYKHIYIIYQYLDRFFKLDLVGLCVLYCQFEIAFCFTTDSLFYMHFLI